MFILSRWLHIYTSCAFFTLLLFFCISGIRLNHFDWVGMSSTSVTSFVLSESITTQAGCEYQLRKIQAFLENKTGLSSPRSIDVALVIGEVTYDYPVNLLSSQ